jgi:hypothetical protein
MAQLNAQESELQLLPSQSDYETELTRSEDDLIRPIASAGSGVPVDVNGWPASPRKLRSNAQSDIFSTIFEVILAFCPVVFLG